MSLTNLCFAARSVAIPVVALLAAGPAFACSPGMMTPSLTPERGDGCAINWTLSEIRAVGLSPVTDLGNGRIMQFIFDGNACYLESDLLVQDCATAAAIVVGPDNIGAATESGETGIDRIAASLESGALADLAGVTAQAAAEGYPAVLTLETNDNISVNGHVVNISCGCETYYPDLPLGASQ